MDRLGSNSSVIRCVHDTNILNQPNKPGHLWLWKNRYRLGLRNPDDLLEFDNLHLLTLTMCMDQWILLPVSGWTYDMVWQIYQPRILLELSERKLR